MVVVVVASGFGCNWFESLVLGSVVVIVVGVVFVVGVVPVVVDVVVRRFRARALDQWAAAAAAAESA